MATGPKLVHKQFNSPIGLYSRQNIRETLDKHVQNLGNGTMGIDFSNPDTEKPGNLANSAVLRMLEEEERTKHGYPNQRKVVWPPVQETNGYHQSQHPVSPAQPPSYYNAVQQPQTQLNRPQAPSSPREVQIPVQHYYSSPEKQETNYSAACEGKRQEPCGLSKLIPISPAASVTPAPVPAFRKAPGAFQQPPQSNRWAPVASPLSPQQTYSSPPSYPSQTFSPPPQYSYPPPQYSQPEHYQPQKTFEAPPSTITLRQQPPIHQKAPPVYASQPAAATFKGGVNMRGDNKWPPQSVKEAVQAENEARRQIAKGPACRPRKVKKDYTSFFAQNALNYNYSGYRAPPGTQHYEDHPGQSSY